MKTVSVALVLCLNIGVDPPDLVKTEPCARLECWFGKNSFISHLFPRTFSHVITFPYSSFRSDISSPSKSTGADWFIITKAI